jgi:hypothetical protein
VVRTQTVDKKRLRFMWHRPDSFQGNWVLVSVDDLNATDEVYEVKGHKHTVTDVLGALSWSSTPGATNSPGTPGQIAYDANSFYVCVAPNTWHRALITPF